jgi:hypothetical protein
MHTEFQKTRWKETLQSSRFTECLVTLCQDFEILFLRPFPVRNVMWKCV